VACPDSPLKMMPVSSRSFDEPRIKRQGPRAARRRARPGRPCGPRLVDREPPTTAAIPQGARRFRPVGPGINPNSMTRPRQLEHGRDRFCAMSVIPAQCANSTCPEAARKVACGSAPTLTTTVPVRIATLGRTGGGDGACLHGKPGHGLIVRRVLLQMPVQTGRTRCGSVDSRVCWVEPARDRCRCRVMVDGPPSMDVQASPAGNPTRKDVPNCAVEGSLSFGASNNAVPGEAVRRLVCVRALRRKDPECGLHLRGGRSRAGGGHLAHLSVRTRC